MSTARKITADPRFVLGVVAAALAFSPGFAFAQPLTVEATQIGTWALGIVKAIAIVFIIGGMLLVCTGRWVGVAPVLLGIIGAAKADTILSYFNI